MPVSMQDVRAILEPEEPDYAAVTQLGPEALPHLHALVGGDDPMLASKAAYAASVLEGDQGRDVVMAAAQHADPIVRVAAAAATRNLPDEAATDVLGTLVDDPDEGVRKVVHTSASDDALAPLRERHDVPRRHAPRSDQGARRPARSEDLGTQGGLMPGEASGGRMPGEATGGRMPGEEDTHDMPGTRG